jgi:hypothetical protein
MTNESCNIRLDIEIPPHYQISAKTVDILVVKKAFASTKNYGVETADSDKMCLYEATLDPSIIVHGEDYDPVILVFIVGEILLIAVVEAIPKDIVVGLLRGGINQMVDAIAAANGELKTLISAH